MADRTGSPIDTGRERDAIDRGETGDKIAQADPAAAPMHTSAEASGHPTPAREAEASVRAQKEAGGRGQQGAEHFGSRTQPQRRSASHGGLIWGGMLAALAVAGLALGFGLS